MTLGSTGRNQDRFEISKSVFFKEWAKDNVQTGPIGPGYYDTTHLSSAEVIQSKRPTAVVFPKMNRGLLNNPPSDSPGPTSYDTLPEPYFLQTFSRNNNNISRLQPTESQFLKQPKLKGGTFGTRDRTLDLTRFNG